MTSASRPPRDYEAYGLSVRSPIPLPFLPLPVHRAGEPDVTVRIGATPAALPSPVVKQTFREIAPGAFLLSVDDVARYLVTNGRDVLVEPRGGSDHDLGVVLGGSMVFAALLQQRGVVTLHASAIETEAGAVLFAGRSGIGKSSLLGAFVQRGYAMLADDVTGVVLDAAGRAVALPAFPSMKLRADALQELAWQGPVREKMVPVERFRAVPLAVRTVCVLEVHDQDCIEVRPAQAADSLGWLWSSVCRKRPARRLGQLPAFFRTVIAMVRRVPVVHVTRPAHPFRLDALADRIEEHLRKGWGRHGLGEPEA